MIINNNPLSITQEAWIRWEPIEGLSEKYYLDSIINDAEVFKVILSDADNKNKKVAVIFSASVYFQQITEETLTFRRFDTLCDQYSVEFVTSWTFFKVINSSYVQLVSEQSCGAIQSDLLVHYSLLAVDFFVDIIDRAEPKVEFI